MRNSLQFYFWLIFLCLLFVPITNSFVVNIKKLCLSCNDNNKFQQVQNTLISENKKLIHKLKYYKTVQGLKTLAKERLNKVEDRELLIKFNDNGKVKDK